jgi:hypothetical protein
MQGAKEVLDTDENLAKSWNEIRNLFDLISGDAIKRWFEANATTGMKSVSSCVTRLTKDIFMAHGWEWEWVIYRGPSGAKETISFVKTFGDKVVGMEVGSRHRQQLLTTFLKANLAVTQPSQPTRRTLDLYFIAAYPEHTLKWGHWDGAVSAFEDYEIQSEVVDGALSHPTVVFALEHPGNLKIDVNLSGSLALELV